MKDADCVSVHSVQTLHPKICSAELNHILWLRPCMYGVSSTNDKLSCRSETARRRDGQTERKRGRDKECD